MIAPLDQLLLAAFLLATLALGLRRSRAAAPGRATPAADGAEDNGEEGGPVGYLLAGRRLTLLPFVATMVSTWYGGILGVGEYTWRYGVSSWLVFGVPYYLAAAIFAFALAGRARAAQAASLPEQLRRAYGRWPARLGAAVILLTTLPAAYLLTLGVLLEIAFGLPLGLAMAAAALFSVAYLWRGGFASVTRTDGLQFVLMFAGFALLLAALVIEHGGPSFVLASTPPTHRVWHGGNPPQAIFVWYVIALATLVEPTFYQRCFAARTPAVARRGLLLSIACWAVFDLLTTSCGLYARALLADLDPAQAAEAFPRLAALVLPVGLVGVFFMSLFAVVMSTVDSYLFVAATTISRDILARTRRWRERDEAGHRRAARLGLIVAALLTLALASASRSVVKLWHAMGTVGACALLIPTVGAFVPALRMSPRGACALMITALPLTATWLLCGRLGDGYPLGLEPIYPGLAIGALIWLIDRGLTYRAATGNDPP